MKKLVTLSMALVVMIAVSGCHSMGQRHQCNGAKCSSCDKAGKMNCPKCGMPKGHCKCSAMAKSMAEINTQALKSLIDSSVPLTLVDARTGKFDDGRRIQNALNLSPDATDEEILRVLPQFFQALFDALNP